VPPEVSYPASVTAAVGLPQPTHDGSVVSLERISGERLEPCRGLVNAREPEGATNAVTTIAPSPPPPPPDTGRHPLSAQGAFDLYSGGGGDGAMMVC
jgi:hypothetical protein